MKRKKVKIGKRSFTGKNYNMSRIGGKDTDIELILRKELWRRGIRYRKNFKKLPGKPDIVITKHKIAIFCDSEFWHGRDFVPENFAKTQNKEFWIKKITANIERDKKVNLKLVSLGYTVIRFWGIEIKKQTDECIAKILQLIDEKSR